MKKLIIILLLFVGLSASAQWNTTQYFGGTKTLIHNRGFERVDSTFYANGKMYIPVGDTTHTPERVGGFLFRSIDGFLYNSISTTAAKKWAKVGGTIAVDTLYQDGLALKWVKGGVTYTLADAFKNLETSNITLPDNRIINLNGKALVFQDGVTHYDFDGSLMTLYIGDLDGNSTEIQQSATNVNIAATSPDDNAAFGFGANLITMGINGSDVSVTQDSIVSEHHIRAKTFQTETGKVKVLDGGVVVQDNTDVTVSYLLGKNVGGYVYDGFGINPADVVTFGLGGSIFMNALDSLRPYHKNNVGLTRKILLQGDAIGSSDATKMNISDTAAMLAAYLRKIDTAAMLLGYQKRCHLQTLTDAATVTWNYATSCEAIVTLAGNRTLSITNLPSNYVSYGTLTVLQDATGSRTLAMPATSKVSSNGAGVITLTTTGNARDVISFRYLPTLGIFEWTYGKNFN